MISCDVAVIGGGPGGLAAAQGARAAGASKVLLLERDNRLGGILNQCIHDGFGLIRCHEALTGPEYARRAIAELQNTGIDIHLGATVTSLTPDRVLTAVTRQGLLQCQAGAVVLATGCRERTRGALAIPGTRPAGIYTAGTAQNLINTKNILVGSRVVILGSGDIGLIMARRLTWEGAKVLCVAEARSTPGGLERNLRQCLQDFGIPLRLNCTVTNILGRKRVEAVELSQLDEDGVPIPGSETLIPCDTLLLSVGLIPENEVAAGAGITLDPLTNGAVTDQSLQTSCPGIFACGNARRVMDLADFVSEQGNTAGQNAAAFVQGRPLRPMPPETTASMAKGLPPEGVLTCVLCPKGCRIARQNDGSFTGNACPKGADFARQEYEDPQRTLTTTMLCSDGSLLPVKTSAPVPRDQSCQLAAFLRTQTVPSVPMPCGTVVLSHPLGLNVNILAAQ